MLEPLVRGIPVILSEQDDAKLCVWAVKTAMVLEQTGASTRLRYFTSTEHRAFRASRDLGSVQSVWIGRVNDKRIAAWGHEDDLRFVADLGNARVGEGVGYVSSIAAGDVVLQVLALRLGTYASGVGEVELTNTAGWDRALLRIYPTSGPTCWPPDVSLALEDLDRLAQRWTTGKQLNEPRPA